MRAIKKFYSQVRYIAGIPNGNIKTVIGNRGMDMFDDVFTNFMEAEYVLFIEEDLECSPDIFRWVLQCCCHMNNSMLLTVILCQLRNV